MIVALSFVAGRVHLRTRFVVSEHRVHETHERKYLYRGQMGTHPNGVIKDTAILLKNLLTMRWPKLHYRNPSNTNVFYWGGKVYCMYFPCTIQIRFPSKVIVLNVHTHNMATFVDLTV